VLVLIPAAGFDSHGRAGFSSGPLLELKPAQPQPEGESPAFPGRVPASPTTAGATRACRRPAPSAPPKARPPPGPGEGPAGGQPSALTVVSRSVKGGHRPGPALSRPSKKNRKTPPILVVVRYVLIVLTPEDSNNNTEDMTLARRRLGFPSLMGLKLPPCQWTRSLGHWHSPETTVQSWSYSESESPSPTTVVDPVVPLLVGPGLPTSDC
jgi:hypothetical protein